eukprot:6193427-Pleurochrysis_carterae.AAC.1
MGASGSLRPTSSCCGFLVPVQSRPAERCPEMAMAMAAEGSVARLPRHQPPTRRLTRTSGRLLLAVLALCSVCAEAAAEKEVGSVRPELARSYAGKRIGGLETRNQASKWYCSPEKGNQSKIPCVNCTPRLRSLRSYALSSAQESLLASPRRNHENRQTARQVGSFLCFRTSDKLEGCYIRAAFGFGLSDRVHTLVIGCVHCRPTCEFHALCCTQHRLRAAGSVEEKKQLMQERAETKMKSSKDPKLGLAAVRKAYAQMYSEVRCPPHRFVQRRQDACSPTCPQIRSTARM